MPKNKGAGGKKRRKGKSSNQPHEMVYKTEGQEYGQVVKSLGNGYMEIMCFTASGNVARRAHIRGSMRKRSWMGPGDIVLVNIRDFQDTTHDICLKYHPNDARTLRSKRLIPADIEIGNAEGKESEPFEFGGEGEESDESESEDKSNLQQNRRFDLPPSEESSDSDSDSDLDLNKLL